MDNYQLQQLRQCCRSLAVPTGASGAQIAEELKLYMDAPAHQLDEAGEQIAKGLSLAREFCEGGLPEDVRGVLEKATRDMRPDAVRGFCLMLYSAFRAGDAVAEAVPDTHLVLHCSDEEIKDIAARDLELHSRDILSRADAFSGFGVSTESLCAALYICSAQGTLPGTLSEAPELLGLCCGAAEQFCGQQPSADDGKGLVVLVAVALALTVLMAALPAFGAVSESLISVAAGAGLSASVEAALHGAIGTMEHLGPAVMGTIAYRTGFQKANEFREFYNSVAAEEHRQATARAKQIMDAALPAEEDA